jgi:hypothetical protein
MPLEAWRPRFSVVTSQRPVSAKSLEKSVVMWTQALGVEVSNLQAFPLSSGDGAGSSPFAV